MQLFNSLSHSSARAGILVVAAAFALGLAACSSNMDDLEDATATGSPFTQALFKDYSDLAHQAAALPPVTAPSSGGFFDSLNPFSDSGSSDTSANDALSSAFANKALIAARGDEPEPEAAPDQVAGAIRARLVRAVAAGKEQSPDDAARAQADYDCWVIYGGYPSAAAASQACKTSLDTSLLKLEGGGRPAPAPMPAPPPAPVTMAPAPAPSAAETPAPAQGEYAVYFDFDSWTLTAEDLKVIDSVIATARSGGQSHITIVGHTDTSGPADYNQKLSVRRANVVVEALVDLGARRTAIHASGVGENDLAVPTPDGVKEAKNRRAVVTLQP
ncbi:MAG TPA: OmpA family protein [Rhizomicrobium sp.]|jgi:OOP family OmpA-OmpF porin|nr:OmpA family protein [Rhizomicrobium sp.]